MRIRFDNIDGFIRVYDGTGYLKLFRSEKYDFTYNRIRYLIGVEIDITYIISHIYAKIKVDSYDSKQWLFIKIKVTATIIYY